MRKAEKIETDVLCTYGCGQKAQYRFVNKKLCCSANAASCKAHKSRKVSRKGMKYKTYDSFSEEIINNVQVYAHMVVITLQSINLETDV